MEWKAANDPQLKSNPTTTVPKSILMIKSHNDTLPDDMFLSLKLDRGKAGDVCGDNWVARDRTHRCRSLGCYGDGRTLIKAQRCRNAITITLITQLSVCETLRGLWTVNYDGQLSWVLGGCYEGNRYEPLFHIQRPHRWLGRHAHYHCILIRSHAVSSCSVYPMAEVHA